MTRHTATRRADKPRGLHFVHEPVEFEKAVHDQDIRFRKRGGAHLAFEVPLPSKALSKNTSADPRQTAPFKKAYRELVAAAAREAMRHQSWPEPVPAVVNLTFGTKAPKVGTNEHLLERIGPVLGHPYRARDVWNAISAFHAGFDGLTDAGVWPDDSYQWASLGSCHIDPALRPAVYIALTERRFG